MVEHYTHESNHTMSEYRKKYICKLSTNGYQPGDVAMLTDADAANFNGGEEIPRFVLADEVGAVDAPQSSAEVSGDADTTPETPPVSGTVASDTGEYSLDDEKSGDDTVNTEEASSTSEQGVQ